MSEPEFTIGQPVVCVCPGPYRFLTEGREYAVTKFLPTIVDPEFTWPAYVGVIDDSGQPVTSWAWRFKEIT